MNITRFAPFDDAFDDLLKGFLVRPVRSGSPTEAQFRMDVTENEKQYVVHAEIPGVKKEDIQVEIDGNQVAIGAEAKQEKEVKEGEKLVRQERYYGKVYRAFALAQDVDESQAAAKYENGVLELTLPKKAVANAKRISIQ
jgi:HSP20 family protein